MSADLEARLDRLESQAAIQQLPIRYALAVDGRDLDAWTGCFAPDVNCGKAGIGRDVLRSIIAPQIKTFYRSIHQICGHRVEFDDADHAHGVTYCRAEHEDAGKWIIMAIAYFDEYARRDGEWFFVRRRERHWYLADWEERPTAPFMGWEAHQHVPNLPDAFPTWLSFWDDVSDEDLKKLTQAPVRRK